MTNLDSILKSRDIILPTKVRLVKAMVFPVVKYGCESWTINKAVCQRIDACELCAVGEDSWESLGLQGEKKTANTKGNQPWIFIARTDAEAPILWSHDVKNWLIGKDPDAGKDWRQEEKETTEDEMVGWHHQLNGHEFEQALGVGDGQGSLVCCSPWVLKELNMTERLNWTELKGLPTEVWPVLSNYIHKDPVSKWGHILRYWVLEFSFLFFFRKTQLNPFRSSEERPHEENKHLDNVRYFVENKVRG